MCNLPNTQTIAFSYVREDIESKSHTSINMLLKISMPLLISEQLMIYVAVVFS